MLYVYCTKKVIFGVSRKHTWPNMLLQSYLIKWTFLLRSGNESYHEIKHNSITSSMTSWSEVDVMLGHYWQLKFENGTWHHQETSRWKKKNLLTFSKGPYSLNHQVLFTCMLDLISYQNHGSYFLIVWINQKLKKVLLTLTSMSKKYQISKHSIRYINIYIASNSKSFYMCIIISLLYLYLLYVSNE